MLVKTEVTESVGTLVAGKHDLLLLMVAHLAVGLN